MKNLLFFLLIVLSTSAFSQNTSTTIAYGEIPESHLDHPELGAMVEGVQAKGALYELVHLRTAHSKTILNNNKTKTTIQSSLPLHYLDQSGYWLSLRHELSPRGSQIVFPSHNPAFVFDQEQGTLALIAPGQRQAAIGVNPRLLLAGESNPEPEIIERKADQLMVINGNLLQHPDGFEGVDVEQHFFSSALINSYVFRDPNMFGLDFDYLVIEENLELPENFTLMYELCEGLPTNRLLILDDQQKIVLTLQQPFISDSKKINPKTRNQHHPYQTSLNFTKTSASTYILQIKVNAEWLKDPDRVFPLVSFNVITIENDEIVNSCFAPEFQQATIEVAVPEGETVLWTDFEYDFVAIGEGWTADQRSYVSGPAGQTAVYTGSGSSAGTQTYVISNSEIGNGESPGEVSYVFHFSRVWGDSGCNATYNFVDRRVVSVTYGTLVFGDGPIMVNEYSASNRTFLDGFGRTEDWIELYNADPDYFFKLDGYYLSNDAQDPTMWQVTNGIIPPGGHLVIFCSQRDISSGMVQHANFNLTQLRPDHIVLTDPDGTIMEAYIMQTTQVNHSYGRVHDGADDWGVFISPTPWHPNNGAFTNYASKPTFSMEAGTYEHSITLAIESSGSNEQIRYTTDGSTPTMASSPYFFPIVLNQTTVVRARAFSNDEQILPGFIETMTYFINEQHTLPVFSFSGDQDLQQLFDGNASLLPLGHFEYFEADGQFIDGNFGDFNKHGNDSWSYPQRGVDFVSRDDYGYKRRLEHKFFNTSDRTRFRRLMVKAAANDNFPFEEGGAHIRDSYIQTLSQLAGLDLDERSSTNILVFLNGQYWGVYDLRERVDDNNFTNHYYGQDYTFRDSDIYLQFLKTWGGTEAQFGNQPALNDWVSLRQYVQNNNMGDPEHHQNLNSLLNIESLIDYFVINSYVVSRDWLNYNTGWWRGLDPAGLAREWRYILWDQEAALGHYTDFTGLPNATATAPPCQVENLTAGDGHTNIISKLIQENPEVRQKYVTRYVDLLNTHFSAANAIAVLDSMVANIAPEMPRHMMRWGGDMTTWQTNVQAVRDFLTERYDYLMTTGLAVCYNLTGPFAMSFNVVPEGSGKIKMNSVWLPYFPFDAQVFGNIPTHLQAQGEPGYMFSHWELDGTFFIPDITNPNIEIMINQAVSVTAHFSPPVIEGELIYYWHFNNLVTPQDVTSIAADYKLIADALPMMTYIGSGPRDIDANSTGSEFNLHLGEPPGRSARVRNPSQGRALVFELPTTGYGQIVFTYAVERTNNGMLKNTVSYSIDGDNFVQDGLPIVEFDLEPPNTYHLVNLDFSLIEEANNNPNFKLRIDFEGNTTGSSGNNRFDNISLHGTPITGVNEVFGHGVLKIYPNPANERFYVEHSNAIRRIQIFNIFGQLIDELEVSGRTTEINSQAYNPGIYIVIAYSGQGVLLGSGRLVKR